MKLNSKEELINKVLKREKLFELRHSRLKRLLRDPIRTSWFFSLSIIARIHPIWVNKETLWGDRMSYYLPEGNQIFYFGFYEANLTNFLIRFLQNGMTFVDIGANVGFYSMLASYLVGKSGKVFSVEPTPRTFQTLDNNASRKTNITPINIALSDREEILEFKDYGLRLSGFNSANPRHSKEVESFLPSSVTMNIKATTLDSLVKKYLINPSFIKMDAEGYESVILKGMRDTLKNTRPVISIEMGNDPEWQRNVTECYNLLMAENYKSFEILNDGLLIGRSLDDKVDTNLIFVPLEKISLVSKLIK